MPHLTNAGIINCDECVQLRGSDAIFAPGVIGRFYFDWTQRNNSSPGYNADVFTLDRRSQPFAKILLRIRDR